MSRGQEDKNGGRLGYEGEKTRIRGPRLMEGEGNEHHARPTFTFTHLLGNELARIRRLSRRWRRRRTVTRGRSRTRERLRGSCDSAKPDTSTSRWRGCIDVPVMLITPRVVSRRRRYERRQRYRRQGCHGCGGRHSRMPSRAATTRTAACCCGALDTRCEHACGGGIR